VSNKRRNRYSCNDCKWNFLCRDSAKCGEFELDQIMSDTYVNQVIEDNREKFNKHWNKYLSEWEDA
jgi:hypothetical protein